MLTCKENIIYRLNEDAIDLCDEVKTIEEKKIPEKLPKSVTDNACSSKDMRLIATTLNEIIDYLKTKVSNNECKRDV